MNLKVLWCVSTGADSLAKLPVLLFSILLAWKSYYFLPSCDLSVQVNMAETTRGKQKTMTTSKRTEDDCDCFCLFVFYLAPPPHSCQPDCLGVAVYLSIFGFSGCCCLDMNHESFSHSLQELLGASCYGYSTSWFRETPCEINLTSETYLFCLSFTFATDAVQFSFWWINRF